MASFSLFGASTIIRSLVNGETGYIARNGALGTTADAITASGSVDVAVLGSVVSTGGNAIDHIGTRLDLFIGTNGSVGSLSTSDTVSARFTSTVFVSNDGYLFSGGDALDLRETDGAASIRIVNTGTISGVSDGIVTDSGTATTRITNFGEIAGGFGGIDHLFGDAIIVNYGSISGENFAYDGSNSDDIDTIKNFGAMDGGVDVRDGDDVVINRGTIDDVSLGAGADIFDGRGGTITGSVLGGLGDDTFIVSQSDISLSELADEGIDLVKSNVNFTLGDNFENLALIGGNDLKGVGNDADNVITGNGGDNVLRGLMGSDTLEGGAGDDILRGGRGSDALKGGSGDDVLRGGSGNDNLSGNDGNDVLIGGAGMDILRGGQGSDVFQFNSAMNSPNSSSADSIKDFELGIDRIDLTILIAGELSFIGSSGFSGSGPEVRANFNGSNTLVRVDVDGDGTADMRIILTGVSGILEADFIL